MLRNRPIGITVLAIFQASVTGLGMMITGVLSLLIEIFTLEALGTALQLEAASDDTFLNQTLLTYGSVLVVGGLIMLVGAIGLWRMKYWGWFTSLAIWTVNLVVTITQMTIGREDLVLLGSRGVLPPVPRLILCVLVIIFLLLPQISHSFKTIQGSS